MDRREFGVSFDDQASVSAANSSPSWWPMRPYRIGRQDLWYGRTGL